MSLSPPFGTSGELWPPPGACVILRPSQADPMPSFKVRSLGWPIRVNYPPLLGVAPALVDWPRLQAPSWYGPR